MGGSISGLATAGLVLKNGLSELSISSGKSTFEFQNTVDSGAAYSVSVHVQPTGQTCSVSSGSGTMTYIGAKNIQVTCSTNSYLIGGTISGLSTSGLILKSGDEDLSIQSGATNFQFNSQIALGGKYSVSVKSQPTGYTCSVSNSSGTMGAGNVTSIQVNCASLYVPVTHEVTCNMKCSSGVSSYLYSSPLNVKVGDSILIKITDSRAGNTIGMIPFFGEDLFSITTWNPVSMKSLLIQSVAQGESAFGLVASRSSEGVDWGIKIISTNP